METGKKVAAVSIFKPFSVEAKNLALCHDESFSLGPLTFKFNNGRVIQILGPNGSGKTTLLRSLCGLKPSDEGSLNWHGLSLEDPNFLFFSSLNSLIPKLTVKEHTYYWQKLYATSIDLAEQALQAFSLQTISDQKVETLSAGQQQRLALIRLTLSSSPVWILDEPFVFLDQHFQGDLEHLFKFHAEQGGMIIFSSHHPIDLKNIQTLLLPEGRIF